MPTSAVTTRPPRLSPLSPLPPPPPKQKTPHKSKKTCLSSAGPDASPSPNASRSVNRRTGFASSGLTDRRRRWYRPARVILALDTAISATVSREVASNSLLPTTKYLFREEDEDDDEEDGERSKTEE